MASRKTKRIVGTVIQIISLVAVIVAGYMLAVPVGIALTGGLFFLVGEEIVHNA